MDGISVNNDDDDHEEEEEEEEEDWDIGFSSTCSKQTLLHPSSEINNDVEETEEDYNDEEEEDYDDGDGDDDDDDDKHELELGCPYCTENLDILGLCCHIDDQHYKEANSGICPVCAKRLETSMTVHIIGQHESFLRALCKQKLRGGGTSINLSQLKKEEYSRTQLETSYSSRVDTSYDLSPDLLMLSFVQNTKPAYRRETVRDVSPTQSGLLEKTSNDHVVERSSELSPVTYKLQDKAQVCEFVKGLVFSTIFDDGS